MPEDTAKMFDLGGVKNLKMKSLGRIAKAM